MAKESGMKRKKEVEEGFVDNAPLTSKIGEKIQKAKLTVSIMLTDRGLYENAKTRLKDVYNGAVSKIRRLFRRK
ncbi:Uncharacterised protein [Candidatus Burarchaeum australiense]|nr:Uncharacterised protein [Candidatus Burarchaeum australiense]